MSENEDIDILLITYNRPIYTRLTLERLFATCDQTMRVWIWHNGNDQQTLEVVQSLLNHPRLFKFYHSPENKIRIEPINWLWGNADGQYLSIIDDDCLMPDGWAQKLRQAHQDVPEFGVIACWHFQPEDFRHDLARKKIKQFSRGHQLLQNLWVQGSGVMMKRKCLETGGLLKPNEGHPGYCHKLAASGWVNGWYFPLIYMEHMDDPRSPHSLLKTDEDFKRYIPFSAKNNNVKTLAQWQMQLKRSAIIVQKASLNPRHHRGWHKRLRTAWRATRLLFGLPGR
jgi:GT2 family glycosyltransferase